ncbi:beta-tubulin cofactor d [Metarhizium album ARSEF 1941]|uniref:Beta-tubulin cofactor d n=1 Tax=Metarhizium album (strain ARSEF 1941) TaxID=1081103 RepID=A0A0B2WME0_METAS|nr:beta-tubulin cofactor d [Metarhizium album ARSEF 1941]KHN94180.1 beta-tubulin cofactor d [Metarhizium album ARSEF 1941]
MDAPDSEFDVKLQKISGDLIADLDRALTTSLRKPDGRGGTRVRSFVRARETFKSTTTILDMYQELPQLLDPHLPKWIPLLAKSYLEHLQTRRGVENAPKQPHLLVPVDYAICRILYGFCKVRGEKVIIRFLNVETRYLEVLLSAIEEAEDKPSATGGSHAHGWEWEQRYVVLLWLSHLLLAPFDLSTISTLDIEESAATPFPGFEWPENLPGITIRVISLAIKYLSCPGKEKDAANALLVRVAMRRDMQQLGVLDALVRWALASLRPRKDSPPESAYFYLGILSFLAGVLRASLQTSDMDTYLPAIFQGVYDVTLANTEVSKSIIKLAVVRKMILKVIRSVIVSLLRQNRQTMVNAEMTEAAIGYLLDSVSDKDTPVRLSASKALSLITLKLDPRMASQVIEAVLDALNRNILWTKPAGDYPGGPTRNLSAVNPLEWHGLMLTLSHLLYRRSPPATQLSDIIHALLLGLSFEQRSTSGGSVGANVRDAACFGIWALARRYATEELLNVPTTSVFAAKAHANSSSILQVLGTELVVTASLDSAGNIRRGASAALQELIGRHPDTVERGIEVVQTVDYHAVARRSRAVGEVATKVTKLSRQYGEALVEAILGWRGIGDVDAQSRRVAAAAFGDLTSELAQLDATPSPSRFLQTIKLVTAHIQALVKRQVEERHGLLLCYASVLDKISQTLPFNPRQGEPQADPALVQTVLSSVHDILEDCRTTEYRRPELIAEGASCLVVSALPVIEAAVLGKQSDAALVSGHGLLSSSRSSDYITSTSTLLRNTPRHKQVEILLHTLMSVTPTWLARHEPETVEPASEAALVLLLFAATKDQERIVREWATTVATKPTARTATTGQGYFHALAMAQPLAKQLNPSYPDMACQAFLDRWAKDDDIDVRVTLLQSLIRSHLLQAEASVFLTLLVEGLNDYTKSARGDVGSHTRVQALRAVGKLWRRESDADTRLDVMKNSFGELFPCILRLAAEKLDRVRQEAQVVVTLVMKESDPGSFCSLTFSSKTYFETLLKLVLSDSLSPALEPSEIDRSGWMSELMSGLVTSADTGSDDVVIASRAAITDFCETSQWHLDMVCNALALKLHAHYADDRTAVPTLEIIAFLFRVGLFQRSKGINLRHLCLHTQKAGYKTGSIRKLIACVKVYGGVASVCTGDGDDEREVTQAGVSEARKRLGSLMAHPWPRVRSVVVDEIWGLSGFAEDGGARLTGVDWSAAGKEHIKATAKALGME